MEGRCRPYRPPMRVQGDEGGKAATAGTGPGSSGSGSGLMLRSLVGCLLPHLAAAAAVEKTVHDGRQVLCGGGGWIGSVGW